MGSDTGDTVTLLRPLRERIAGWRKTRKWLFPEPDDQREIMRVVTREP